MTSWQPLVRDLVHRTEREVLAVLDGLDPVLLDTVVQPGTNSIGWLVWHLTRSHDRNVSELRGQPQLWLGGWHTRFGRAADPDETGYRHSAVQAAAFRSPGPDVLAGYHRAVVEMIDDYLDHVPGDDLGRLVASPTLGDTVTVHRRIVAFWWRACSMWARQRCCVACCSVKTRTSLDQAIAVARHHDAANDGCGYFRGAEEERSRRRRGR